MLKNYFKIAWRNLLRDKWYTIQNIAGLSVALTVLLVCLLYGGYEYRFDRHHSNADKIYRVNTDLDLGQQEKKSAKSPDVIGPFWQDFSQVEAYVRIFDIDRFTVKKDKVYLRESRGAFVDPSVFKIFDFHFISRSHGQLLTEPQTVVITSDMAKKYFGKAEATGKWIEVEDLPHGKNSSGRFLVTAVIEEQPKTSSFAFDFLFSMKDLEYAWGVNYAGAYFTTFVLLKEGANYQALNKRFQAVTKSQIYPVAAKQLGLTNDSWKHFLSVGNRMAFSLFPLTDIHLLSNREDELGRNSNIQTLYILGLLSLFAILMGIVNFINLATARANERLAEIGIRKTLGGSKTMLVTQIYVETFILLSISFVVSCIQVAIILPFINDALLAHLGFSDFLSPVFIFTILGAIVLVGYSAGWYPAVRYSRSTPLAAMHGQSNKKGNGFSFRKAMVTFQLTLSVLLIIGTIVTYRQLEYIQHKDVGYAKEGVLIVRDIQSLKSGGKLFKEKMLELPEVKNGTLTGSLPVNSSKLEGYFSPEPGDQKSVVTPVRNWWIDEDYLPTMGIELITGNNFSAGGQNNFTSVIINEEAAEVMGLNNPINAKIYADDTTGYKIIGLVNDFHFESLRESIGPLLLSYSKGEHADLAVFRFDENTNINQLIQKSQRVWEAFSPTAPMDFYFLSDAFNDEYWIYRSVLKIGSLMALISILIACVGLFGMINYVTQRRRKEVGIRKVLGASVSGIVALLSRDFVKLALIAVFIATPIAWWGMNHWLEEFAYRIELEWWMFALAGLLTVVIALLTISFQSVKAAVVNPVNSLRSE